MNILLLVVLVLAVIKLVDGYKKGMVKEIISFVTLVVMCVVVLLLATALRSYMEKEFIGVVIALLLLMVLGIAHHVLKLVFFSAKLIAKLPVVHSVDKLLGMVVGVLEVVLVLWTVYTFIMYFGIGILGNLVIEYSRDSQLLTWLYEHNMLAEVVEKTLSRVNGF